MWVEIQMKSVLPSKQWFRRGSAATTITFLCKRSLLYPSPHTQMSSTLMTTNWCGLGREMDGVQKIENAVFESRS